MVISYPDTPAIRCLATDVARQATVRRTSSSGDGAYELGTVSVVGLPSHRCREQPGRQWCLQNTKEEPTRLCQPG